MTSDTLTNNEQKTIEAAAQVTLLLKEMLPGGLSGEHPDNQAIFLKAACLVLGGVVGLVMVKVDDDEKIARLFDAVSRSVGQTAHKTYQTVKEQVDAGHA